MKYTVLSEKPENSRITNKITEEDILKEDAFLVKEDAFRVKEEDPGKSSIIEDVEEPAQTRKSQEAGNMEREESDQDGPRHGEREKNEGPDIIDYTPDFSVNKKPIYPTAAKRMQQQGSVKLTITANDSGSVIDVAVEKSSGYVLLDNAAVKAVKKWDFAPVVRDGRLTIIRTEITFRLRM